MNLKLEIKLSKELILNQKRECSECKERERNEEKWRISLRLE